MGKHRGTDVMLKFLILLTTLLCMAGWSSQAAHAENMSYVDNGQIKLGINLDIGGAITYISKSGSDLNLINSCDWGRQIQMSHYAGPVPFEPNGQKPHPAWTFIGWNPIQAGDCNGIGSKVIAHK